MDIRIRETAERITMATYPNPEQPDEFLGDVIWDYHNGNRYHTENVIFDALVAHGTSATDLIANSGGSVEKAAQAIEEYYDYQKQYNDLEPFVDCDGDELDITSWMRDYLERQVSESIDCPGEN